MTPPRILTPEAIDAALLLRKAGIWHDSIGDVRIRIAPGVFRIIHHHVPDVRKMVPAPQAPAGDAIGGDA